MPTVLLAALCRFTAAANLHEGAVCANYPYDGFTDHSMEVNGTRNPAPDDATFVHIAKAYASAHKFMAKSKVHGQGGPCASEWLWETGRVAEGRLVHAGT